MLIFLQKNGYHKIELAENTGVFITKSQHAQLTMHGYANPRKVLLRLLDMLIDLQTLAMTSALGSRSAINKKGEQGQTIPIPLEIKSGISGTFFVGPCKRKYFVCMCEYIQSVPRENKHY